MGEDIPPTPPVAAPPGCDAIDCGCWPAGETPTYVLFAFSGIRKCSDDSLWVAMNQDFILQHTVIACVWEFAWPGYKAQLIYWDHGFPPMQLFTSPAGSSIFRADMANCTMTGTWANINVKGDCGGGPVGYGGFGTLIFGQCP